MLNKTTTSLINIRISNSSSQVYYHGIRDPFRRVKHPCRVHLRTLFQSFLLSHTHPHSLFHSLSLSRFCSHLHFFVSPFISIPITVASVISPCVDRLLFSTCSDLWSHTLIHTHTYSHIPPLPLSFLNIYP